MTNIQTKLFRGTTIALMLSAVPVASNATGHDASTRQAPAAAPAANPVQQAVAAAVVTAAAGEATALLAEVERLAALNEEASRLRPGQFIWRPERAASGPVEMVVSIESQMAYVYRGGELIGVSTVSTGRRGHRTPTGTFPILQKNRRHFSNLYNNAPMPNMQRLTWGGIALHAGALPGYPASHGCVRLPLEFSRLLFGVTRLGSRVHIIAAAPPAADSALHFATGAVPSSRAALWLASSRR